MPHIEISTAAYPELMMGILRDEIRRSERQDALWEAARRRHRARRAALRVRVWRWLTRQS